MDNWLLAAGQLSFWDGWQGQGLFGGRKATEHTQVALLLQDAGRFAEPAGIHLLLPYPRCGKRSL